MTPRIARCSLALLIVAAAACGSDSTDDPATQPEPVGTELPQVEPTDTDGEAADGAFAADTVMFVWAETGGCAMMGPNCARYEITYDGSVSTYREGETDVAATGTVDAALVMDWVEAVDELDVEALQERVGEGEMTAAFDGTDIVLAAPYAELELSSIDTRFAPGEPVFSAAQALASAAQASAQLELEQR